MRQLESEMKNQNMGRKVEEKLTTEMAVDVFRNYLFNGVNAIGFAAAGYLILRAVLTIQTGGAL